MTFRKSCNFFGFLFFLGFAGILLNFFVNLHIKVYNKVEIGGGSSVIKNISDNTKVMGYPAKNIREFLRDNK